jgi:hypothetical protein
MTFTLCESTLCSRNVLRDLSYTATKIPFIYSFSGNSAASAPISTFMCLWAIYIVPGSVYIFPPAEQGYRSWKYINRSQTHECRNWNCRGPDIPFLGIFVSKFRYFVFEVYTENHTIIYTQKVFRLFVLHLKVQKSLCYKKTGQEKYRESDNNIERDRDQM